MLGLFKRKRTIDQLSDKEVLDLAKEVEEKRKKAKERAERLARDARNELKELRLYKREEALSMDLQGLIYSKDFEGVYTDPEGVDRGYKVALLTQENDLVIYSQWIRMRSYEFGNWRRHNELEEACRCLIGDPFKLNPMQGFFKGYTYIEFPVDFVKN